MWKRVVLALALVLTGIALAEDPKPNPGQIQPYVWPPLPPELPPEFKIYGFLTNTPKQFLPHPGTIFRIRRASGYIPVRCQKVYDLKTPRVLDCWLEENATIANSITWNGGQWRAWTPALKDELRATFQTVRNWRTSGFGPWPGPAFDEPPVNLEAPFLSDSELRTVIDSDEARRRFLAQVAVMLASEIDAWVPWSLHDYNPEILGEMFRADLYQYHPTTRGHSVSSSGVTPAHVATLYRFFLDEGIIDTTPVGTIARLLEWCRDHMAHDYTIPGLAPRQQYEAFWHYTGNPPVVRILEGTVVSDPTWPGSPPRSWTAGCTGTTRFLRSVLRVLNIPVREILTPETGTHAVPFFSGEGLYLSHGDDPYNQDITSGDFTGRDLLINSDQWMRWFGPGSMGENIGRRTVDLNLTRPSGYAVSSYCYDQWQRLPRDGGRVFAWAGRYYSLAHLESIGFYTRLAALAETATDDAGYCELWRASR